jgi:hypothetical protein
MSAKPSFSFTKPLSTELETLIMRLVLYYPHLQNNVVFYARRHDFLPTVTLQEAKSNGLGIRPGRTSPIFVDSLSGGTVPFCLVKNLEIILLLELLSG